MNRLIQLENELKRAAKHNRPNNSSSMTWSGALETQKTIKTWQDAKSSTIRWDDQDYPLGNRLDTIVQTPSVLDQDDEGNCGFTATLTALLALKRNTAARKTELITLLNAIHKVGKEIKYKGMTLAANQKERNAGVVQNRIQKRLRLVGRNNRKIADYTLIVAIVIFFKTHIKQGKPKLWKRLAKFNEIFEHRFDYSEKLHEGNVDSDEARGKGYKHGDFALTSEGLDELLTLMGISHTHYTADASNYQATLNGAKQRIQNDHENNRLAEIPDDYTLTPRKGDSVQWEALKWPCIVGIYDVTDYTDMDHDSDDFDSATWEDAKIRQHLPYNLLTHWVYMPDASNVWTWGKRYAVTDDEETELPISFIPVEVMQLG